MPKNVEDEATLYEQANGSPLIGYLLLKSGGRNVPANWLERYTKSRRNRHKAVAEALRKGLAGYATLEDWQQSYLKECFYYGIRILFELERDGKTNL